MRFTYLTSIVWKLKKPIHRWFFLLPCPSFVPLRDAGEGRVRGDRRSSGPPSPRPSPVKGAKYIIHKNIRLIALMAAPGSSPSNKIIGAPYPNCPFSNPITGNKDVIGESLEPRSGCFPLMISKCREEQSEAA
jgi:hypothetical protein